jgi:hypothetical protein
MRGKCEARGVSLKSLLAPSQSANKISTRRDFLASVLLEVARAIRFVICEVRQAFQAFRFFETL